MQRLTLVALSLLAILISTPLTTRAQSKVDGWCEQGNHTVSTQGLISTTKVQQSYPSCTVTIFDAGTANLSTIFSDGISTPKSNPFTADSTGYWFFYANNGLYDIRFSGGGIPAPFTLGDHKIGDATTGIGGSGTANRVAKFSASTTLANSQIFDNGTNVGIGTTSPSALALLDLTSTTSVFIPPRMTTAQRDAIITPPNGSLIWNTTTLAFNQYNSGWGALPGAGGGISTINPGGLVGPTVTFQVGSAGTDFAVSGAANTVTFNLPTISGAATRGILSNGSDTIPGSKTFTGAVTTVGASLIQAIGGCDPNLPPNLVGTQTIAHGTCASIALDVVPVTGGDYRQFSAWVTNSGSRPTVAGSFIALGTGLNSRPFGSNPAVFASSATSIGIAEEVDQAVMVAGGQSFGLVLVGVGTQTGSQNHIQIQASTSNGRPSNGIVFNKSTFDPINPTGAAITFLGGPAMASGVDFSGASFSTGPYLLANNSFPRAKNSGGITKIVGGIDATDFMLFQSGGSGVRWVNSANTLEILRVTEAGNIIVGTSAGGVISAAGSILGGSPHFGGDTNSSTLTLRGTSSATPSSAFILLNPIVTGTFPGTVGIGMPSTSFTLTGGGSPVLGVQGSDNTGSVILLDSYSAAGNLAPNYYARAARGTAAVPTQTQSGDPLGVFGAGGWQSTTSAFTGQTARMLIFASENYTSIAQGSKILWQTQPIGTVTLTTQMELTDSGDLRVTRPQITPGSGTGLTVNDAGSLQREVYKVTVTFAALSAAALTADKTIATLPAKTRLVGIIADTTQVYAGGAVSAATIIVGKTVGGNEYIVSHSVFGATVTKGLLDADLGASLTRATAIQGGDLPSWTATTIVSVRLTTVTANTNALTQGSTTYYLICEKHP